MTVLKKVTFLANASGVNLITSSRVSPISSSNPGKTARWYYDEEYTMQATLPLDLTQDITLYLDW
ncbi:MAG: hypothetical protein WC292_04245 [Clostridia bacterium]